VSAQAHAGGAREADGVAQRAQRSSAAQQQCV
jgi:hypothetical protein